MMDERSHRLLNTLEKDELIALIEQMARTSREAQENLTYHLENHQGQKNRKADEGTQLNTHWRRAYPLITKANRQGGCSATDEEQVIHVVGLMEKILTREKSYSWNARKVILDDLLEQVVIDNSPFTELLVDLSVSLCQEKKEHLYRGDFFIQNANDYYKEYGERIYNEFGAAGKP